MPAESSPGPEGGEFGVYVHVPFCRSRCDYCAFATWTDKDALMGAYVAGLHRELELRAASGAIRPATSVFFGGGTPSRIPAGDLCGVLASIERREGAEVTVECNPEDVDAALLAAYAAAGVTRLSVGIQSTAPRVLADLGRRHGTGALASVAAHVHDAGFTTWNADLIIGAVTESDDDLSATLDDVLSLAHPPPHVSAYALTPEPGTPLGRDLARHPDDDVVARRYELVERRLSEAGYRWEEISNWALPGHEARHNHLYWTGGEYAGVGCAAHSHLDSVRSWNVRTPERYLELLGSGVAPTGGSETLDDEARRFESLALLLRTRRGVPLDAFEDAGALGDLICVEGDRAVLTVRGRLLASQVSLRLATRAPGQGR